MTATRATVRDESCVAINMDISFKNMNLSLMRYHYTALQAVSLWAGNGELVPNDPIHHSCMPMSVSVPFVDAGMFF